MPLLPSEPPQLVPSKNSLAGIGSRFTSFTRGNSSRHELHARFDRLRRAAEVLHRKHGRARCFDQARRSPGRTDLHQILIFNQMPNRRRLAAQADQQIRRRCSDAWPCRRACD